VAYLCDIWYLLDEHQHIVAFLDVLYPEGHLQQATVNALREVQSHKGMISASEKAIEYNCFVYLQNNKR
jgi:hypothetical protein